MHYPKPSFSPLPLMYKVLGIVLVVCLFFIGLLGLILPIIPGVVFLALAIYVLTRISRRAAAYAHSKPWISRHLHHLDAVDRLSIGNRLKVGLWVMARGVVKALAWGARAFRTMLSAPPPSNR